MKSKTYQLVGIKEIEVTDAKSGVRLTPEGEFKIPLVGQGINDKGEKETMCVDEYESSIWLKDHQNKDIKKKTIKDLVFKGGVAQIPVTDTKEISMIEKWAANKNNKTPNEFVGFKPTFQYIDNEAIAEKAMRQEEMFTKAKSYCFTAPSKRIHAFATYKDIDVSQYSEKELRYLLSTKFNPDTAERFVKEFESDSVDIKYNLKASLDMGEIVIDERSQNVVWGDTGKVITSYSGNNAMDALLTYCKTAEGKIFYQSITSGETTELDRKSTSEKKESVESSESVDISVSDAVELGIEKGLVEEKDSGLYYFDGTRCGKGKEKVLSHFSEKKERFEKLKDALGV